MRRDLRDFLLKRLLRDQAGHLTWAFGTVALPFVSLWFLLACVPSAAFLVWREIKQFPSHSTMKPLPFEWLARIWDPVAQTKFWTRVGGWDTWLDASGYATGAAGGLVFGVLGLAAGFLPVF